MTDELLQCDEAIEAAEAFPSRRVEYKGLILQELARLRVKIVKGKLTSQDERAFTEIILLTEKWREP